MSKLLCFKSTLFARNPYVSSSQLKKSNKNLAIPVTIETIKLGIDGKSGTGTGKACLETGKNNDQSRTGKKTHFPVPVHAYSRPYLHNFPRVLDNSALC